MSPVEPSPDDSLVVFRVECPALSDGRLALLGGEGLGDWNPLAARLGVNYPQNSTTWYIPVYLDLTTENKQTVKFRIVKLDCNYNVTDRDPVGMRTWMLPPGGSSFSLQWGRPEAGSLAQEDLPTKEADGIDLSLTAWTSHVVGTIKTLHLPSTNGHDFFNSQTARAKLMKYFTYHPNDYQQTADNENAYDVEPDEVRIDIASSGETVDDSVNPPPYSSSSTPTIRRIRSVQGAVTPLTRGASRILRRGFSSIGRAVIPTRRRATTRSSPVVAN